MEQLFDGLPAFIDINCTKALIIKGSDEPTTFFWCQSANLVLEFVRFNMRISGFRSVLGQF